MLGRLQPSNSTSQALLGGLNYIYGASFIGTIIDIPSITIGHSPYYLWPKTINGGHYLRPNNNQRLFERRVFHILGQQ